MTPFEQLHQAWLAADRAGELNRTVERLAREGIARSALDDALGRLLDRVRADGGEESDEEIVAAVGDRLHGWCHASLAIGTNESAATIPPVVDTATPYQPTPVK